MNIKRRILLFLSVLLTLATVTAQAEFGMVRGGSLRLRKAPAYGSAVIATYSSGTWVEVLGEDNIWLNVLTESGKEGYMDGQYILRLSDGDSNAATVKNNGKYVNLRAEPSSSGSIIARISDGDAVTISGESGRYYAVEYGALDGYMLKSMIAPEAKTVGRAYVTTGRKSGLHLRSGPSKRYEVLGTADNGTHVDILVKGRNWHKVRSNGVIGFMEAKYLKSSSSSSSKSTYGVIRLLGGSSVPLLLEPSDAAQQIASIPINTRVRVFSKGSDWTQVSYQSLTGYVRSGYVEIQSSGGGGGSGITGNATLYNPNGASKVNMRDAPGGNVIATFPVGTAVYVMTAGGWSYCNVQGIIGYISSHFITQ